MTAKACRHFSEPQFQARLDGSQRYAGVCGDFALGHLLVECEMYGGALRFGESS